MERLERIPQRLPVRLWNAACHWLSRWGRSEPGFADSEEALLEAARQSTGLDDFGGDFRPGFRRLLEAYDQEARLSPFGRFLVSRELAGILRNRLRAEGAWAQRPELLEAPLSRPLFVLGLPRTGTTALHHLLARDPAHQVLPYWLAAAPGPRPPPASAARDPRYREAARGLRMTYALDPGLKAIHLMTPDGPEECRHLLGQSFTDDTFECNSHIPSYSEWYAGVDMRGSYRRHRQLLQWIQSGVDVGVGGGGPPARWVLKYPAHLRHLRALLAVYPDACFVWCHRDPARVLPSLCSLIAGWRGLYEEGIDPRAIGEWQLELWSSTLRDAAAVRDREDPARFFDLHYAELLADPVEAVRRAYEHLDFPWSGEAESAMGDWQRANPQGRHGEHRYGAERFGFAPGEVARRFAGYSDRFGVEPEP